MLQHACAADEYKRTKREAQDMRHHVKLDVGLMSENAAPVYFHEQKSATITKPNDFETGT